MDILNSIKEQISLIKKRTNKIDLSDLIVHLERAEYFYAEGKETQDDNFFTDVIYRTNQVFEGALREAYKVLSKQEKKRINTFEIEKYFSSNKILNDRVLQFFTVYRQNWRNESAHNYKLFFNESEALLAITSVSSFAYVLINQILEVLAFQTEKTKDFDIKELLKITKNKNAELDDKLVSLIKAFIAENKEIITKENYKEFEFIGLFNGFLSSLKDSEFIIQREPKIKTGNTLQIPDMIVELNGINAIIEFKRKRFEKTKDLDRSQLIKYLWSTEIKIGIIFYFNLENVEEVKIEKNILTDYDETYKIIEIY